MKYKNCIYILNRETKNKNCKTVFSKRIKSEFVIIWFTYLFVNMDTQITFANWHKPLVIIYYFDFMKFVFGYICSGSEFQICGTKVLKLLLPYLALLWTFTCILFVLCVSYFVLWNISSKKAGLRLFRALNISNPSVLKRSAFTVLFPDLSRRVL